MEIMKQLIAYVTLLLYLTPAIMFILCGADSSGSGKGLVAGSYKHSNEPSVSVKLGEFLNEPNKYLRLIKNSAPD
jgi:hypothetical protein